MREEIHITNKEWYVMKCLWEQAPKTLMELVGELKVSPGWSKSTCATMVRRMTQKGLIRYEEEGKTKRFFPQIAREDVEVQETKDFLQRIYNGSIGMMMSTLVAQDGLTGEDIAQLRQILQEAEENQSEQKRK